MKKYLVVAVMTVICANCGFAAPNYSLLPDQTSYQQPSYYENNSYQVSNNTLKGRVVTVPAGQTFRAIVTSPISTETAVVGQTVTLVLGTDFFYNGIKVAPTGSAVYGSVIETSKAKHGSMNGKLTMRFTQIITPTGQNIPISAIVKTNDNTGTLMGGTRLDVARDYAKDIVVGAGAGALTGVVISPLSGGDVGRGTTLATAVGAGGGLVKSIWDKGAEVSIPNNATIELILTQPITTTPISTEDTPYGQ